MKNIFPPLLLAAAVCSLYIRGQTVRAQGTAFTYSGALNANGNPANGSYDLEFTLFDSDQPGGNLIAGPATNSATAVTNGVFTTTIDFGAAVFTGTNYWLELGVQTNGGAGFTTLGPRQSLLPAPYSIFANTASNVLGPVSSAGLSGVYGNAITLNNSANSFTGDGTGVVNVDALTLNGLTSAGFWNIGGNAGADPASGVFIGTTDILPLEFKVNASRAMRFEYAFDSTAVNSPAPNVIGGSANNTVTAGNYGAIIAGGGNATHPNHVTANYASILGGYGNTVSGDGSTVLGTLNTASGGSSTVLGTESTVSGTSSTAIGYNCNAIGDFSTAIGAATRATGTGSTAMGFLTQATAIDATSMGFSTLAAGSSSVAMGESTTTYGIDSIAMGFHAFAEGNYTVAGGYYSTAYHDGSFVWADHSSTNVFQDAVPDQFVIRASGGVGIGSTSTPPGGLRVASGGIAVSGASSPNYGNAAGVFIEAGLSTGLFGFTFVTSGQIFAFDYPDNHSMPLLLNSPGGNVGIGTTIPDALLSVNGSADKPGGGSWTTFSDARLKDVGADFTLGITALEALQPVHYHYKSDNPLNLPSQPEYVGVVAQQVRGVIPDAVQQNDNGYLSVNNDPIIWTMVNAIKELDQKREIESKAKDGVIQTLKQQNESLAARLSELEATVKAMAKRN